jgi:hypothetical protein
MKAEYKSLVISEMERYKAGIVADDIEDICIFIQKAHNIDEKMFFYTLLANCEANQSKELHAI